MTVMPQASEQGLKAIDFAVRQQLEQLELSLKFFYKHFPRPLKYPKLVTKVLR